MATVNSTVIGNAIASPLVPIGKVEGKVKESFDTIAVATGSLASGSIILVGLIPSNAVITSVKIFNDALDSNATKALAVKVGLFYTGLGYDQVNASASFGTAISDNCLAASGSTFLQSAVSTGTEIRFSNANVSTLGKEAWDLAGLSTEVKGWYCLGITVTTAAATAAAGNLAVKVSYILPN